MDREKQIVTLTLEVAEDELLPVMLVGLHRTLGALGNACSEAANLLASNVDFGNDTAEMIEEADLNELLPALNIILRLHKQLQGFADGTYKAKRLLETGELPPPKGVPEVEETVIPQAAEEPVKRSKK